MSAAANIAPAPLSRWQKVGVRRALDVIEQHIRACKMSHAEWSAKHERGECEWVSVITEANALWEAEAIKRDVERLLGYEQ